MKLCRKEDNSQFYLSALVLVCVGDWLREIYWVIKEYMDFISTIRVL